MTFHELGLKPELLSAITELGFESPMPVQEQTIPFIFNETDDLVALAQTGTGKTAAFGLPILNLTDSGKNRIQSLILAPTRELCIQISNDLKKFAKYQKGMRIVPVYGGESIVTQLRQLDTPPQVLVATPGRLLDMIRRKKVLLDDITFLVLDEADEMLNMGFLEDIETILKETPESRRTMLFSATMPQEIARIAKNYMKSSKEITVGTRNAGSENVKHIYYVVQAKQRYLALKRAVDVNPDIYGIVFCRTRQETKEVAEKLMQDGYNADALHGDLSQAQRDAVMQKFRMRNIQFLVATDVAARGLDVSDLTHVINYNLPDDAEVYTHRSGRTGRANKSGISISIIHVRERNRIRELERLLKKEFTQVPIPNGLEVCKKQLFHLIDRMENVEIDEEQISPYLPEIIQKLDYLDKSEIIKRFVSLEFNRFLEYYRGAPDLNLPEKDFSRKERGERGEKRGERGEKLSRGGSQRGKRMRFKINVGDKQNFNPSRLLSLINETTNDKSISIGSIEITNKFSFFDIFADQANQVMEAFEQNAPGGISVAIVGEGKPNDERKKRSNRSNDDSSFKRDRSKPKDFGTRNKEKGKPRRNFDSDSEKPWRRKRN